MVTPTQHKLFAHLVFGHAHPNVSVSRGSTMHQCPTHVQHAGPFTKHAVNYSTSTEESHHVYLYP